MVICILRSNLDELIVLSRVVGDEFIIIDNQYNRLDGSVFEV